MKMLCDRSRLSLALFQILYANEGESKNPQEKNEQEQVEDTRGFSIQFKDHQFCIMHYHTPTNCEFCPKTMWNMIKPPPALECRRRYFVGVKQSLFCLCKSSIDTSKLGKVHMIFDWDIDHLLVIFWSINPFHANGLFSTAPENRRPEAFFLMFSGSTGRDQLHKTG